MASQTRAIAGYGVVAEPVLVSANVSVTEGCEINTVVRDSDTACFILGGAHEPAELTFDAASLRQFVGLADRAIREMDVWRTPEDDPRQ